MLPSEFYSVYSGKRSDYETRAENIAAITLPYVIRTDGATGSEDLDDAIAQSFNGRLCNTLKSKMGMALLPPSTSSFRLSPDAESLQNLTQGDEDMKAESFALFSSATARINAEIESQQIRDTLFDSILQWIIVGSSILEKIKGKGIKQHVLKNIAVKLDTRGEPLAMCIREFLFNLPEGVTPPKEKKEDEPYELFTMVEWDDDIGTWIQTQDIDGEPVGNEVTYSDETLPYQYVGWTWVEGDAYHRPYAEDYYPDMVSCNQLSGLLNKGSIVAAKVLLFVDERKQRTRIKDVVNSANGDVLQGRAEDVTALQLEKNFDFQVPQQEKQEVKSNLASAFLMNESVTRDAERVTAEEIRFMAQELETSSLSGTYSRLAKKVSKRIVTWVMLELGIKFDNLQVDIITGLDALGRSQEAQKLDNVMQRLSTLGLQHWIKESEIVTRYLAFEGVDSTGLLKTPNEVKSEQAQQAKAQTQQVGEEAMATSAGQEAGKAVVEQGANNG